MTTALRMPTAKLPGVADGDEHRVGPEHRERPVGEIDHVQQAVDDGQAAGQEHEKIEPSASPKKGRS